MASNHHQDLSRSWTNKYLHASTRREKKSWNFSNRNDHQWEVSLCFSLESTTSCNAIAVRYGSVLYMCVPFLSNLIQKKSTIQFNDFSHQLTALLLTRSITYWQTYCQINPINFTDSEARARVTHLHWVSDRVYMKVHQVRVVYDCNVSSSFFSIYRVL